MPHFIYIGILMTKLGTWPRLTLLGWGNIILLWGEEVNIWEQYYITVGLWPGVWRLSGPREEGKGLLHVWGLTEVVRSLESCCLNGPEPRVSSGPCTCVGSTVSPSKPLDRKGHKQDETPKINSQRQMQSPRKRINKSKNMENFY